MADIRLLTVDDAEAYKALRLRALMDHPEAFGSSYEEERNLPPELFAERFFAPTDRHFTLGVFVDGHLAGSVSLFGAPQAKTRHKATLGAMYVSPEARRRGIGRALLGECITMSPTLMSHVEELALAVTVGNDTARALYMAAGFQPYCVTPRYLKLPDGSYHDLEWMALRVV